MIKITYFLFLLFFITGHTNHLFAAKQKSPLDQKCLDIHNRYLKEAYDMTKNCVGFSAPISARAYTYFSIGMYESTVEILPEMQTLSGQLSGYERKIWADHKKDFYWPIVVNTVDQMMLSYLYRVMPPSNALKLKIISDSIYAQESKNCSSKKTQKSVDYGIRIAQEIITWSMLDHADNGFNENYPESYVPPQCISCWSKTTPGYLPSLLPYWGDNRTMFTKSHEIINGCTPFIYSKDTNSLLYENSIEILEISKSKNPEFEYIAEYWNDAAGYSGTPAGHLFTLAQQLAMQKHLKADKALELYVKLGITLNEASITCWKLKYTYNFLRPITYIHRMIDPQFNTTIDSPPFPEFPSGHSFQSGAGSEIFKSILGDSFAFTDSTNLKKRGIDNTPRSYANFTAMSEEISLSRLYGGIHYRYSLDQSLLYGRKLGIYILGEIKCRK